MKAILISADGSVRMHPLENNVRTLIFPLNTKIAVLSNVEALLDYPKERVLVREYCYIGVVGGYGIYEERLGV